jgi:hypothetical protein
MNFETKKIYLLFTADYEYKHEHNMINLSGTNAEKAKQIFSKIHMKLENMQHKLKYVMCFASTITNESEMECKLTNSKLYNETTLYIFTKPIFDTEYKYNLVKNI